MRVVRFMRVLGMVDNRLRTWPGLSCRDVGNEMRKEHVIPSVVIVTVLLAQGAATVAGVVIKRQGRAFDDHFWPFMDYPMYSEAYGLPVQTSTVRLAVTLPDGRLVEADAAYMGLDFFGWRYHIVERLVAETPTGDYAELADAVEADRAEALRRIVAQVEANEGVVPAQATVHRKVYTVGDHGLTETDTEESVALSGALKTPPDPTDAERSF